MQKQLPISFEDFNSHQFLCTLSVDIENNIDQILTFLKNQQIIPENYQQKLLEDFEIKGSISKIIYEHKTKIKDITFTNNEGLLIQIKSENQIESFTILLKYKKEESEIKNLPKQTTTADLYIQILDIFQIQSDFVILFGNIELQGIDADLNSLTNLGLKNRSTLLIYDETEYQKIKDEENLQYQENLKKQKEIQKQQEEAERQKQIIIQQEAEKRKQEELILLQQQQLMQQKQQINKGNQYIIVKIEINDGNSIGSNFITQVQVDDQIDILFTLTKQFKGLNDKLGTIDIYYGDICLSGNKRYCTFKQLQLDKDEIKYTAKIRWSGGNLFINIPLEYQIY